MDWFRPLGIAGLAWRSVATVADRRSLWTPALIVAASQLLVLLVLLFFHLPGLVRVAGPLVQLLGGESATHYPAHIEALPGMLDRACLALEVLLAWVALGATTLRFAGAYGVSQDEGEWAGARHDAVALAAIVALGVAARLGLSAVLAASPVGSKLGTWAGLAGRMCAGLLVQTALAYAAAFLLLRGASIRDAVAGSLRLARRNLATTLILVAVPAALVLPSLIAAQLLRPFAATHPGLVAGVLAMRVGLGALATVLLVGSATRLFLSKSRMRR